MRWLKEKARRIDWPAFGLMLSLQGVVIAQLVRALVSK